MNTNKHNVNITCTNKLIELGIPAYATDGSAGIDLKYTGDIQVTISPLKSKTLPTGLKIAINNPSMVAFVASRSGLYNNHNVRVGQGLGTIDSDYRGEIMVMLHNDDTMSSYVVQPGERIAQLIFMPIYKVNFNVVASLDDTNRGEFGLGSTGRF